MVSMYIYSAHKGVLWSRFPLPVLIINFVETCLNIQQPSRLHLGTRCKLSEWKLIIGNLANAGTFGKDSQPRVIIFPKTYFRVFLWIKRFTYFYDLVFISVLQLTPRYWETKALCQIMTSLSPPKHYNEWKVI